MTAIEETHLDEATARGMAKGKSQGEVRLEGRIETARRMLAHGLAPEHIAEYTDLSLDEIEGLTARDG